MGTRPKEAKAQGEVDSIRHKDKRANIPTEELRDFVADEEKAPKKMLYPRDPSLDPQLVWKGKDEQDAQDLAVPVVPVYIQEKIHPQALIEDLRAQAAGARNEPQAELFADFNGIDFEHYIEFYQHGQHWTNRMILGDSLLVMASLAEKEALKGKVQMIYMDPPYGIKFGSNWQVSTRKRDVKDGNAEDLTRQPEQVKAFRDTWKLGIHSYLAYLRDRLITARDLLTDGGSVFVQIGDENVHLTRNVLDEVFGSENFMAQIAFSTTTGTTGAFLPGTCDYLLWFAKAKAAVKYRQLFRQKEVGGAGGALYTQVELQDGRRRAMTREELGGENLPEGARAFGTGGLTSSRVREARTGYFPIRIHGSQYLPGTGEWKTNGDGIHRLLAADRIALIGKTPRYVRFFEDFPAFPLANLWSDVGGAADKNYVVQTASSIVQRCMLMATDPGDLVLDPTCGSGTTAYVAEQWGRRWITIDTSRVALALARTRLMAARYPYYVLADSAEGIAKESELSGTVPSFNAQPQNDVKRGFVSRRVPHVMLKSIANNEEIDTIYARNQEQMELLRTKLNATLKQPWQEWEIPQEADAKWPATARRIYDDWWKLRRERQQEIDRSIAKRADTEYLYDQPYEDPKRIRVSGPFTVESLSPHRVLAPQDEDRPATERIGERANSAGDFVTVIIENLRKAGIKGTEKGAGHQVRPAGGIRGRRDSRDRRIHLWGQVAARGRIHRPAVRHGRSRRYQGGGEGGRPGRRL